MDWYVEVVNVIGQTEHMMCATRQDARDYARGIQGWEGIASIRVVDNR